MSNFDNVLTSLHNELAEMVERKKWNIKAARHIARLDIDAEQLWVLRFHKENGILPTIKQAEKINEAYDSKKLTVKAFKAIMASRLKPKWLVLHYDDVALLFERNATPEEMKYDVLKILQNWKNNRSR